ncbi:MAG TPA: PHB depolymerase family esterase [Polyangiales bacterium]|nr:PHB depolymerase family esterase [Polyangiales bacterium]
MSERFILLAAAAVIITGTPACSSSNEAGSDPGSVTGTPAGTGSAPTLPAAAGTTPPATGGTSAAPAAGSPPAAAGMRAPTPSQAAAGTAAPAVAGTSAAPAAGSGTAGTPAAGMAGGPPSAGESGEPDAPIKCGESTLRPGDTTLRTAVGARDGGMRTYIVHVPASYDGSKPVPLMINFHPLIFGTGAGQRRSSGWAEIGDREGMITAFPDGYDAAWDIGNCCTRGDVDDLGFAKAMVAEISKAACIDPNRVYASGYSMGGGMSHLIGCKQADIFAAVAPSAFDLTQENHTPCQPSRPITVFMHRGMGDTVVPYAGGPTTPPNGTPVTVTMLGAVGSFNKWSEINKCTDEPVTMGNCRRRSKCDNGVEVVLCENGSHVEGPADVIWQTLKKHGLRGPL